MYKAVKEAISTLGYGIRDTKDTSKLKLLLVILLHVILTLIVKYKILFPRLKVGYNIS